MIHSGEFAKLWEPGIPGIELFDARIVRHSFGKHFHETYTIGCNTGGQGCFQYRGATHYAYPGRFNLINPGEVHTGQAASNSGWSFRNLYVSVPCFNHALTQLEWRQELPYFREPVVYDPSLQQSFSTLFHALSQPASLLEQQSLLLEVLSQLLLNHGHPRRHLRSPKPETKAIAQVRAYLETHYAHSVAIDELAQLVGLSPYYLIRSFREQVGIPPHGYQRHWQLVQAKRSLRTGQPLSDIAVEHGFYDQSHLNRVFKQTFGITPGQYRKDNFIQYNQT